MQSRGFPWRFLRGGGCFLDRVKVLTYGLSTAPCRAAVEMIPLNSCKCHVEVLKFEVALQGIFQVGGIDNHSLLWSFQIL